MASKTLTETKSEQEINIFKSKKDLAKEKLEKYRNEETKMVKGIFQFFECPNATAHIFVSKYSGVQPFNQVMEDGKEYEIPLYVARHLNGIDITAEAIEGKVGSCSYPVHSHILDGMGNPTVSVGKRVRRFGFQSMEFFKP